MMHGLRILPQADADVDAAIEYIAMESVDAAGRFIDAVEATYQQLCDNPLMYPLYPLVVPGFEKLRKCSVGGFRDYLVFYQVDADVVVILRVIHGARDLLAILQDD